MRYIHFLILTNITCLECIFIQISDLFLMVQLYQVLSCHLLSGGSNCNNTASQKGHCNIMSNKKQHGRKISQSSFNRWNREIWWLD